MMISEVLKNTAEEFFNPVTGSAEILVNEFSDSEEFVSGHRVGHCDAYQILLGLADHFEAEERALNG